MREIIFRAWDKEKKKMIDPVVYLQGASKNSPSLCVGLFTAEGKIKPFPEKFDLVEYTGVTDLEKTKIFSADILTLEYDFKRKDGSTHWKHHRESDFVSWGAFDDGDLNTNIECWLFRGRSLSQTLSDVSRGDVVNNYWEAKNITFKIVGNTYQNSELLNK